MIKEKLNFLVLDDSMTIRTMISDELKTFGYEVHQAASIEEAKEILNKFKIDILFLDLKLPGIGGLEYLKEIQQEKRDIIVIVITAYESPQSAVEAIEKGAYDYVIKPIEPGHLELIVARALKRYEVDQERKAGIERRLQALVNFTDDIGGMENLVEELKSEVNGLLKKLGRPPKYTM